MTGYVLQGYTATGTYVHPGTCAVDPRVLPLGSYIMIYGHVSWSGTLAWFRG